MSDSSLTIWGWLCYTLLLLLLSLLLFDIAACGKHLAHRYSWPPPCPQTFHIKVNFWTCTDDQAEREWGLVSADPWDEDYCCTWWKGAADIANKGSQSGNAQDLCLGLLPPNPPSLLPYPNMTASLLRAKVWGQFFCNQYSDHTFSSAHVYGNDHLWWVVTAVSAWCWTLIGCICCQEVWGPFDLARLPRS